MLKNNQFTQICGKSRYNNITNTKNKFLIIGKVRADIFPDQPRIKTGQEKQYATHLGGLSKRSLVKFFLPELSDQVETIPGIKDMIAKYI